jgi:signal transduction histidine kinase
MPPAAVSSRTAAHGTPLRGPASQGPVNEIDILLLEDLAVAPERILATLAKDGPACRVRRAHTLAGLETALAAGPVDLVLAGAAPEGFEPRAVIAAARAIRPDAPVVFFAGDARVDEAVELLAGGAADYVPAHRFERLATALGRALADAALRVERRRADAALRFLADAGGALVFTLAYEDALARVTRRAVPEVADLCWIDVLEAKATGEPPLFVAHGDAPRIAIAREIARRFPASPGEIGGPVPSPALERGRSEVVEAVDAALFVRRARDGEHLRLLSALGLRSLVAAPMTAGGRTLGAITLGSADPRCRYGPLHVACVEDLARRAGAVIEQARLHRAAIVAGRAKDELLARAAHELRTPLCALLGWASMLRTRRLDEAARARALEIIERNARVEAQMIEDLLDLARSLTGTLQLDMQQVEPCSAVATEVEALRPMADERGVALSAELDDAAGAVEADPARLGRVIHELVGNALRFTPRGGRVGVRLARAASWVELSVRDTGRGIPPSALPHLFDSHRRRDEIASRGLGIGLVIARHLVEAHGGAITAESPGSGMGATFTVRLPAHAAPG